MPTNTIYTPTVTVTHNNEDGLLVFHVDLQEEYDDLDAAQLFANWKATEIFRLIEGSGELPEPNEQPGAIDDE